MAWTVDNCLRLWDYVEGRCVKTYQGHSNQKYSISGAFGTYDITSGSANKLSPVQCTQQAFIASGSEDGDIVLWDVSSKRIMQRLQGHDGPVLGVDTHPSQSSIVSCGMDGTVRIWQDDVT